MVVLFKREFTTAWLGVICGAIVAIAVGLTWHGRLGDSPVYETGAERIVRGEMIYRPDDPPAFTYPPFFALVYVPLLALPAAAQLLVWNILNVTLMFSVLAIIAELLDPWLAKRSGGDRRWRFVYWGIVAVLGLRFLISPLEYRSHEYWVLLSVLLSAHALAGGNEYRAGLWAGLAAACKATPLLLLPMFFCQRRWRAVGIMLLTLSAATLLPDVLFPSADGRAWCLAWYEAFVSKVSVGVPAEAPGAWSRWNALNQSLAGTLYRLCTSVPTTKHQWDASIVNLNSEQLRAVLLFLNASLLGGVAWGTRSRRVWLHGEGGFWVLGQYSLVLCGMLLLSPMSSKQHFCALIPAIACLTAFAVHEHRDRAVIAALGCVFLMGTLGAQDLIGSALNSQMQAYGTVTGCALVCFAATLRILIIGPRLQTAQVPSDSVPQSIVSTGALERHVAALALADASGDITPADRVILPNG